TSAIPPGTRCASGSSATPSTCAARAATASRSPPRPSSPTPAWPSWTPRSPSASRCATAASPPPGSDQPPAPAPRRTRRRGAGESAQPESFAADAGATDVARWLVTLNAKEEGGGQAPALQTAFAAVGPCHEWLRLPQGQADQL